MLKERTQAMQWWNNLPDNYTGKSKGGLAFKYGFGDRRTFRDLTGREIESIWEKENPISPIKETFTREEVLDVIRRYEDNLEQWFNENC